MTATSDSSYATNETCQILGTPSSRGDNTTDCARERKSIKNLNIRHSKKKLESK